MAALSLLGSVWLIGQAKWGEAAILSGFVLGAVLAGRWQPRAPAVFTFLFAVAGAVNAAGYVFELWHDPVWFDEVVHILTPFTLVAAVGWHFVRQHPEQAWSNCWRILAVGASIGLVWEAFELLIGIVGTWWDTLIDLTMDMLGSAIAACACIAVLSRNHRIIPPSDESVSSRAAGDQVSAPLACQDRRCASQRPN